ncbi:hypothetical protein ACEWA3_22975 [Vibrio parahaemolyticus]
MQKIFYVSFFLFVIPWVGKQHYPEVFGVWYVQWPSIILSMALLGVGFAQSICLLPTLKDKTLHKLLVPMKFLIVFALFLGSMSLGLATLGYMGFSLSEFETDSDRGVKNLIEALYSDELKNKENVARAIYTQFGVLVSYDSAEGRVIFKPSEGDARLHREYLSMLEATAYTRSNLKSSVVEIVALLISGLLTFVMAFLLGLYRELKTNKAFKSDSQRSAF